MASTKKANYSAKVKYWANGVTGESSGGIVGCIRFMFLALPLDKQKSLIESLHAHTEQSQAEQHEHHDLSN